MIRLPGLPAGIAPVPGVIHAIAGSRRVAIYSIIAIEIPAVVDVDVHVPVTPIAAIGENRAPGHPPGEANSE